MITYNHERYIRQAVESVLMQETNTPVEIVIGEDCSTDQTRAVLGELQAQNPGRLTLQLHNRNVGMGRNFSHVYEACTGEYVAILEGDDYWTSPYKLQRQIDAMEANPTWAICFHAVAVRQDRLVDFPRIMPNWHSDRSVPLQVLLRNNVIQTCSVMYRRSLLTQIPAWFDELPIGDWPLHILFGLRGDIGYIGEVMAAYRMHGNSVWSNKSAKHRAVKTMQTLQVLAHQVPEQHRPAIESAQLYLVEQLAAVQDLFLFRVARAILSPALFLAQRMSFNWRRWQKRPHDDTQ